MRISWTAIALAGVLAGCGGGGGSSDTPAPTNNGAITISGLESINVGDGAAFFADLGEDSLGKFYQWQQLSGPELNISNPNSPVVSFPAPILGSYSLQVDVDGESEIINFSVTGNDDFVNSYSDQQAVSGGRVSLRAEALDDFAETYPTGLNWEQVSGPEISDKTNEEPQLLTFTAPIVTSDTELVFELTGSANGISGSDQITVLVTADQQPNLQAFFDEPLARVMPYVASSPYADNLASCVYSSQLVNECHTEDLPLIGQAGAEPTIEQVLNRVVVSHPWMGEQFETFLREHDRDGDFRRLLSAVTAVVISSDVRPSFYWAVTGAIYLDPEYLWQQPWQRNTINEDPDYRTGFGSELQFLIPWRYVKNGEYASLYYPKGLKLTRPWSQIEPDLASLLYHELAHANDFFPRSIHSSISADSLLDEAINRLEAQQLPSDILTNSYGLNSEVMAGLGQVSFRGETATDQQKALRATDVATEFFADRASDYYAYSSIREDLAMLFEETMMQLRYGIFRDVAVSTGRSSVSSEDLIVAQGQRGRAGDSALQPRVELVFDQLLPEVGDPASMLAAPQAMTPGLNWFDAINIGSQPPKALARPTSIDGSHLLSGRSHFGPRHQERQLHH